MSRMLYDGMPLLIMLEQLIVDLRMHKSYEAVKPQRSSSMLSVQADPHTRMHGCRSIAFIKQNAHLLTGYLQALKSFRVRHPPAPRRSIWLLLEGRLCCLWLAPPLLLTC